MVVTNHSANNDIICYIYPILSDCVVLKRLHSIIDINSIIHKGRVIKIKKVWNFPYRLRGGGGGQDLSIFHIFLYFFS